MNFPEQPPSKQWAVLKFRGDKIAEVWFKPEGDPCAVIFRIPQKSFQIPGVGQQLTTEWLLKAVAIAATEIESWRHGGAIHPGMNGSNPEFRNPFPPPQDDTYLEIYVRLKPLSQAVADNERSELETPLVRWEDLESRWKTILGLESTMNTFRIATEGLLVELEASLTKTLTVEEKVHALRADIAQWDKAKNRVRFVLPKMKEFIHRSVWVLGAPERRRLGQIYQDHIQPRIAFPKMDEILKQLEDLQKDRQILAAQGVTVSQEARAIATEVQGALRTLQSNAATNARSKRGSGAQGKFFKSIRRATGAG